ncbi:adenylate cyclase type 3-like [Penaeus japonicus]|uniref:adenylate cyclase type 3-like n=1 Tax=Penaeus japonicus TaxID=27405 RepID=UPI001C70E981|nr:adenylate cyclase type 3-like [Penaeus japonicus]
MEDEADGKLILKEDVKVEITESGKGEEAELCTRLQIARKSLTRCHGVEETFEGEYDPCLTNEANLEYENESFEPAPRSKSPASARNSAEVRLVHPSKESPAGSASPMAEDAVPALPSPATPNTEHGSGSSRNSSSSGGCEEGARDGYDDISASMSVIRMEKFALEKRRVSRILPKCLHRTFVDPDVEQLFQAYHERQRRADLHILLAAGGIFTAYSVTLCLADSQDPALPAPLALACIGAFHVLLLLLCRLHVFPERSWILLPYLAWALFLTGVGVFVILGPLTPVPRNALLWLILLHFLVFVGLPLRLPACLALTAATAAAHLTTSVLLTPTPHLYTTQVLANFLLVSAATLLGLMSYFFADKKHRRAFLETRQSLEVKMVIEEQSREQGARETLTQDPS